MDEESEASIDNTGIEAEPKHDEHREMTDQGVGKLPLFGMCLQESSIFLPS